MSFGFGGADRGASSEHVDSGTPWIAASDGNLELLKTSLRTLHTPATVADENGYTLLQAAASYGQLHVMRWLLAQSSQTDDGGGVNNSINVNAVDSDGDTALHYASTVDAARFLCQEAGIDRCARNSAGKTALQTKREELQELVEDEDYEETDYDAIKLRSLVDYLSSLDTIMQ